MSEEIIMNTLNDKTFDFLYCYVYALLQCSVQTFEDLKKNSSCNQITIVKFFNFLSTYLSGFMPFKYYYN